MYILETKDYKNFKVGSFAFEGALKAGTALPGDFVEIMNGAVKLVERSKCHTNLVGTLELAGKARYGFTSRQTPIYLFIPWNESYPPFYVGSSHNDLTKNVIAVVDFESWIPNYNCPRGVCKRIVGQCGILEVEEEALLIHACPTPWKKNTSTILDPARPPFEGGSSISDSVLTFHVDPPGCLDIDDAISILSNGDGSIDFRIHIANVGATLLTNPWLWDAEKIGQTVYRDGKVVRGMFPPYVEEKLSLLPFQQRQTITLGFTWGPEGVSKLKWYEQEITVKRSYTYETIVDSEYAPILEQVTSDLVGRHVTDPHDWIAELMLFYNKTAAGILRGCGKGVLRRHGEPDFELLKSLEESGIAPSYLAYRSGEYCLATSDDVGHWGLGAGTYCHATSPIRRWADCINQTALLEILFGAGGLKVPVVTPNSLNQIAKRVKKYERDLVFVKSVLGGETLAEIHGVLVNRTDRKLKIWVPAWSRIISVAIPLKGILPLIGQEITATIFVDAGQRNWKRRIVYRLV